MIMRITLVGEGLKDLSLELVVESIEQALLVARDGVDVVAEEDARTKLVGGTY